MHSMQPKSQHDFCSHKFDNSLQNRQHSTRSNCKHFGGCSGVQLVDKYGPKSAQKDDTLCNTFSKMQISPSNHHLHPRCHEALPHNLPQQQLSLLNRFQTAQGHCGACKKKWNQAATDLYPCGEIQMMSNIIDSSTNKVKW